VQCRDTGRKRSSDHDSFRGSYSCFTHDAVSTTSFLEAPTSNAHPPQPGLILTSVVPGNVA